MILVPVGFSSCAFESLTSMGCVQVFLRPLAAEDADAICRLSADPAVAQFIYKPQPFPDRGGANFVAAAQAGWEANSWFAYAIVAEGHLAGLTVIDRINTHDMSGELFYWLGVPYWNQGIGTQAVQWTIDTAFQTHSLVRLRAYCLRENIRSVRLLHKLGFRTVREFFGAGDFGGRFAGQIWVEYEQTKHA